MLRLKGFWLPACLGLFTSALMAATPLSGRGKFLETRCLPGSDGPKPFTEISGPGLSKLRTPKIEGGIKEFLLWESQNELVYRNEKNVILSTNLAKGCSREVTSSPFPLSRVVDPKGRFLALEKEPWVFDSASHQWIHYSAPKALTPVFWSEDNLYSVRMRSTHYGEKHLDVYQYTAGSPSAYPVCDLILPAGQEYKLAQGHHFPFLYLYSTTPTPLGPDLNIFELNIAAFGCGVSRTYHFYRPMAGPVQGVYLFGDLLVQAIKIDNPKKNLLWNQPSRGCTYYDIGNREPIVLNEKLPVIAAWAPEQGTQLFFLEKGKKLDLLQSFPIANVSRNDFWLTSDARTLLFAPLFKGEMGRYPIQIPLTGLP